MTTSPHRILETAMFEQPTLFPPSDLKTEGYAQPEARDDEDTAAAEPEAEAA